MTQSEKLRLCAEALGLPQFVDFAEAPFPDAQAFALLAWLCEQKDVQLVSLSKEHLVMSYKRGTLVANSINLRQFLIDCTAAVMVARRGK